MLSFRSTVTIAAVLLSLLAVSLGAGCATQPLGVMPEQFDTGQASAQVAGLSCPLCAESLIATVQGVDGVEAASLDLEAGLLTMTFGKVPPSPADVARSIEDAGFTLVSFGLATN